MEAVSLPSTLTFGSSSAWIYDSNSSVRRAEKWQTIRETVHWAEPAELTPSASQERVFDSRRQTVILPERNHSAKIFIGCALSIPLIQC